MVKRKQKKRKKPSAGRNHFVFFHPINKNFLILRRRLLVLMFNGLRTKTGDNVKK